ncbi:Putative ribosomal pseudouridine synthase [uncultured Candidatus Thioglobus sp.]|nr:Putative ribosomal pseudouridine synthase [uncultured Candidatus Thioglobus sp.]
MPFVVKKYPVITAQKIQHFLVNEAGLSASLSQKLLAKNRVFDDQGQTLKNGQKISAEFINVAVFEGHTRGLKPIFETLDFAIFDKPSGILVHPTRKTTEYCLLDEVYYHFGNQASLAHRIDAQTSGLVLVGKDKKSSSILKTMFENRAYNKEYLAIVKGQIMTDTIIDKPISKANSSIAIKVTCDNKEGKPSKTKIYPLKFNQQSNTTLVKATPITGRQHQIRVHLDSIGHSILGDCIYGVDESVANECLSKDLSPQQRLKLTGAKRLMLHANRLSFTYKSVDYDVISKQAESIF